MTTTSMTPTLTGTYAIDPTQSSVGFVARHAMVTKVRGSFNTFEGSGYFDTDKPSNSELELDIEAASIDTRNADRDGHLRSNDFFDMENHPLMTSDQPLDRHLGAIFNGLVTAIYLTKQLVWTASASQRGCPQDLLGFLVEQSHLVDEAEARIDGRAARMAAPSSHERRNLPGEVGNDVQAALVAYQEHVSDLTRDIRRRVAEIGDADEAKLLVNIAAGLEARNTDLVGSA